MTSRFPALIATFSLGFFSTGWSQETSIVVTSASDDGPGSLREAIAEIDEGGTITFSSSLNGATLILSGNQLTITKSLVIDASSLGNGLTIDADGSEETRRRIFEIQPTAEVTIANLSLSNGFTANGDDGGGLFDGQGDDANGGGAIFNEGRLTLFDCTFTDNQTGNGGNGTFGIGGYGGHGGAIANYGALFMTDCTFTTNQTGIGGTGGGGEGGYASGERGGPGGDGGAISNAVNCTLTMTGCTLANNKAGDGSRGGDGVNFFGDGGTGGLGGSGGAIVNDGTLTMTNCTLTENQTGAGGEGGNAELRDGADGGRAGHGGAIQNGVGASLTLIHCTLTINQTNSGGLGGFEGERDFRSGDPGGDGQGGGISNSGSVNLTNTIVSANVSTTDRDIFGTVTESGTNILNSDFPVLLRPLGDYGGPTYTMPPLQSSPAVDGAGTTDPMGTDQRGFNRFADGDSDGTSALDIGAIELQGAGVEFDLLFSLDSDGDGLNTIEEMVLGTDPLVPDNNGLSNLSVTGFDHTTGIPTLGFTYRDAGVRLRITRSPDLITFETIVADSESTDGFEASSGNSRVQLQDAAPPVGRAFYRLEIIRPE